MDFLFLVFIVYFGFLMGMMFSGSSFEEANKNILKYVKKGVDWVVDTYNSLGDDENDQL